MKVRCVDCFRLLIEVFDILNISIYFNQIYLLFCGFLPYLDSSIYIFFFFFLKLINSRIYEYLILYPCYVVHHI